MKTNLIIKFIVLIPVIACGVIDFKTRRIPNFITFPFIIISFFASLFINGVGMATLGLITSFLLGSLFFAIKGMGGGDVKLMMGIATALGVYSYLEILFIASVIGAIWGLGIIARDYLNKLSPEIVGLGYKADFFKEYVLSQLFSKGKQERITVPFGTCLAIATLIVI